MLLPYNAARRYKAANSETSDLGSCILNSRALAQEDEESAYVKYAYQLVKDSNNSTGNNSTGNNSTGNNSTGNNSTGKNATTIPLPAKGPRIPAKGYLVQQIRDHLYWVTDGDYKTKFLVTDKGCYSS
jgi:uncharacterized protein YdeI (BOF family)